MQRLFGSASKALILAAAMMSTAASPSGAQSPYVAKDAACSALELAFTYDTTNSLQTAGPRFWMQGGGAQIHGRFYRGWGAVADISGTHIASINSTGVGLDLVTATFGPRYTWSPKHRRYSVFAQGLGGEAWGMNSVFPNSAGATTTANSFAVKVGGGLNLRFTPHLVLRVLEADYLRTQLPNSSSNVQNNLQLCTGIVLRFR